MSFGAKKKKKKNEKGIPLFFLSPRMVQTLLTMLAQTLDEDRQEDYW